VTSDERIALEERLAHAELARDNALVMRDEAQAQAKEKTRRAGEEIARLRAIARQLRAALADLVPPHASWCMGHEGGVVDGPHGRIGVGKLVVVACRCSPEVQAARRALEEAAQVLR
jgi:hypothetical protein